MFLFLLILHFAKLPKNPTYLNFIMMSKIIASEALKEGIHWKQPFFKTCIIIILSQNDHRKGPLLWPTPLMD